RRDPCTPSACAERYVTALALDEPVWEAAAWLRIGYVMDQVCEGRCNEMQFMNAVYMLELARHRNEERMDAAARHRLARSVAAGAPRRRRRSRAARLQVRPEESRA